MTTGAPSRLSEGWYMPGRAMFPHYFRGGEPLCRGRWRMHGELHFAPPKTTSMLVCKGCVMKLSPELRFRVLAEWRVKERAR